MTADKNKTTKLSPAELYKNHIVDGTLAADPLQESAINALDDIYKNLIQRGDLGFKRKNLFSSIFKQNQKSDEDHHIKGLYLFGSVGRGKSMVMDLFYECLPDDMRKTRIHFHAFMIKLHDFMHDRRKSGEAREGSTDKALLQFAEQTAKEASVLCFDEFHVTDVADAMLLGRLFTAIFDYGVTVIATSNWPPHRLYEGGLQRELFLPFISLLKTKMDVFELDGDTDYRLEFMRDAGVYFYPLGPATDKKTGALFEAISNGQQTTCDEIEVKGRTIEIPTSIPGIARVTFSLLCERPLGAEDYLAIADRYHTIFLDKIPKLNYDRRNEAKRFMNLIDALYEKNIRVVFSADAQADKLYLGHDHAFEFERTVSRLMEMQSEDYLEKTSKPH